MRGHFVEVLGTTYLAAQADAEPNVIILHGRPYCPTSPRNRIR
jgi:hypothetical protein